ncbi:hypothetical protein CAPTEDRAFT_139522 [Capitella teleta]|uniref:Cadherin domain-containing protein n=1 Tax=Capitella teleta TaxID=283909 RepID=R7TK63_CAPTE|nr:hypothetical protein CAPTEDRAFT_139522 [Capitella teleta]|eukprot:ELT94104.1 hypothetical protein CAPTEDRAFT_139522 [Capitella teleta]
MTLEVIAKDPQGLTNKALIIIHILDVNDNSPIFVKPLYTDTIKENTPGGSSIVTVLATDADPGLNGKITYSIKGNYVIDKNDLGDLLFQVDSESGLITVKHQADFESHTFIKFEVLATDGGGRTGSADVEVTIEDVNDYRPTFVKDFFNLEVPANIKVGSHVVTLRATDNDSGQS